MITLHPTKEQGATAQPSTYVYVEPDRQVRPADLEASGADTGLNLPFVMDFLSAALAHERCGRHLYRSVEGRSLNPVLKGRYKEFGAQTQRHVEVLEELIATMGGDPCYVSPQARAVEGMDSKVLESTFLLDGSLDAMTREMAMLDAVLLAETIDHGNWSTLSLLVDQVPEGEVRNAMRRAVDEVEDEEDEHLEWARLTRSRLVMMESKSGLAHTVAGKAEEVIARVKGWLS